MTGSLKLPRWFFAAALMAIPVSRAADLSAIGPATADALFKDGLAAEAKLDSRRALEFFLQADKARPNDALIVQKIARQYSDLIVELSDDTERQHYAETALTYSRRAVQLDPKNAVNVLSVAVCFGKLAVYGDTRTKIQNSRLVKEGAEHALALDPNYAWAHHLLGRWNYEVATLGTATKFFVRVIYGGLPDASTAQGVVELSRAVELEPGEIAHQLELGFALLADGQKDKARAQFEKGLAMPSRGKHDEVAKARAREALEKLS
jgi:tetratricopeptide (TPR) repeat protein